MKNNQYSGDSTKIQKASEQNLSTKQQTKKMNGKQLDHSKIQNAKLIANGPDTLTKAIRPKLNNY